MADTVLSHIYCRTSCTKTSQTKQSKLEETRVFAFPVKMHSDCLHLKTFKKQNLVQMEKLALLKVGKQKVEIIRLMVNGENKSSHWQKNNLQVVAKSSWI